MDSLHSFLLPPLATDFVGIFGKSHLFSGKLFVIVLMFASVYCWSVMVSKGRELKAALGGSKRFKDLYRQDESKPLGLFLRRMSAPDCPLKNIYMEACKEIAQELESGGEDAAHLLGAAREHARVRLNPYQLTAIRNAAERAIADEALKLEERMGWLATAANTSPLLGLLGTIWGVMDTFASMGEQGNASIAAVAPGISSALMTTFFALIVAIPSAVGYNALTSRVHTIAVQMDNFADEVMSDIQRAFMREQ
jgi:biopolymer transport protein TolQ